MFYLTIKNIRRLTFQFAEINKLPHNFNKDQQKARKKWFYFFMKRHSNVSFRQSESTSLARSKGFNRENVYECFHILERILDEHKIYATRIYNGNESSCTTVEKVTKCGGTER